MYNNNKEPKRNGLRIIIHIYTVSNILAKIKMHTTIGLINSIRINAVYVLHCEWLKFRLTSYCTK